MERTPGPPPAPGHPRWRGTHGHLWTAVLPPDNNPFLDDHLVQDGVLVLLALMRAGRWLGLGASWESLPFVKGSRDPGMTSTRAC